jgi:transcriptional regulator with XRE-family HTH domain
MIIYSYTEGGLCMNIVKELRKRVGIQQKELAIAIGVSRPTVSEWESGKKDPSGERLKKLAAFFQVDELVVLGKGLAEQDDQDNDLWVIREQLRRDPNMRVLFDAAAKASPEHLRAAAAMLKALEPNDAD